MTTLRIGLVGGGRLAEEGYLPALRRPTGCGWWRWPNSTRSAAAGWPRWPACPAYPNAAGLLAAEPVDALVIATPAGAHLADARLAAAAGLPTLVEKPPAADLAEAAELAGLVPTPWIGFNRRFDAARWPGCGRRSRAVPRSGCSWRSATGGGGWGAHTAADDALLDLGPHLVDLARWLTRRRGDRGAPGHRDGPSGRSST